MLGTVLILASPWVLAFDQDEARMLARQNGCFKCHSVDKKKTGPAYQDVATKYRNDTQATAKLLHHLTAGVMVKFPDGSEEEHRVIKTGGAEAIENLIAWLLSQ